MAGPLLDHVALYEVDSIPSAARGFLRGVVGDSLLNRSSSLLGVGECAATSAEIAHVRPIAANEWCSTVQCRGERRKTSSAGTRR